MISKKLDQEVFDTIQELFKEDCPVDEICREAGQLKKDVERVLSFDNYNDYCDDFPEEEKVSDKWRLSEDKYDEVHQTADKNPDLNSQEIADELDLTIIQVNIALAHKTFDSYERSFGVPERSGEELLEAAKQIAIDNNGIGTGKLSRVLDVDRTKALAIINRLEKDGVLGPRRGSKPRELLINRPKVGPKEIVQRVEEPEKRKVESEIAIVETIDTVTDQLFETSSKLHSDINLSDEKISNEDMKKIQLYLSTAKTLGSFVQLKLRNPRMLKLK